MTADQFHAEMIRLYKACDADAVIALEHAHLAEVEDELTPEQDEDIRHVVLRRAYQTIECRRARLAHDLAAQAAPPERELAAAR